MVWIGTRARNGGSFLECDVSPGPKQREACPSTVSSASDERMPQRSSTGHFPSLGSVISIHCYYADSWFSMTSEVMNIIRRSRYN